MRQLVVRLLVLGAMAAALAACGGSHGRPNTVPVANAGSARTVAVGDTVTLDGSASSDADSDPLTYSWTLTSRPAGSAAVLSGADSAKSTFRADIDGAYVATLVVSDGKLSSLPAAVTINAAIPLPPNQLPAAGFVSAATRFAVPLEVYFDAAASGDPDGSLVSYEWSFGDGTSGKATDDTIVHRYPAGGNYTVTLKVTDDRGGTATATSPLTAPLPFYKVTNLGSLGGHEATGYGINDAGDVVGYSVTAARQYHAFIHSAGVMKDIGTLEGTPDSAAYAINASGQIVGVSGARPFLYSDGTWSNLSLLVPYDPRGWAFGINTTAQVAGTYYPRDPLDPLGRQTLGFLTSGSLFTSLPSTRRANDISDTGTVVGIMAQRPFAYSNGVTREIGSSNFLGICEAMAVNEVAQVVGVCGEANIGKFGRTGEQTWSFLIEQGVMRDLGTLGDRFIGAAWDVNDAGQVVGTSMGKAFMYDDAAMYDLNALLGQWGGPPLREANAINRKGQIVANGCDASNVCYSFRLDPIYRPVRPDYCASTPGGNTAPTAAFSATPVEGPSPLTVWFDATQSSDAEGSRLSYSWNFGDGTGGVGARPFRVYGAKGQYTVTLEVRDECGARASASRQVVVLDGPPVIDRLELYVVRGMTIAAAVYAHDPEGEALRNITWAFGDGTEASGAQVEHTYANGGTYTVSVVVTDQGGLDDSASQSITVRPPEAAFSTWVAEGASPLELSFDADASSGSNAMDYRWDFGDGATATGRTVTHVYAVSGIYQVVLTVFDYTGDLATLVTEVRADSPYYALVELVVPEKDFEADDLNDAGVVAGDLYLAGARHAAVYSTGTIQDLGTLGGYWSGATAVNNLGQVVGWSYRSGEEFRRAFLYRDGAMHDLGTLGGRESGATDINNVGEIVGTAEAADGTRRPFLYRDGVMQDLEALGCAGCEPWAINDAGQMVGRWRAADDSSRAFLLSDGVIHYLEPTGASWAGANDINSSGAVVGDYERYGDLQAFIYIDGVTKDLGTLDGDESSAQAINDAGSVVGNATTAKGAWRPFLHSDGVMRDLNTLVLLPSGLRLEGAYAINESGQIVASGCYADMGRCASFRLDPQ